MKSSEIIARVCEGVFTHSGPEADALKLFERPFKKPALRTSNEAYLHKTLAVKAALERAHPKPQKYAPHGEMME